MGILKEIGKAIVKKFKNQKGKPIPTVSASSSKATLAETEKPSENILSVETTIAPYPTATTDTAINIETTTHNNSNTTTIEDQNTSSATLIVDNIEAMEITVQEPNPPDSPPPDEPCFDSDATNEKPLIKTAQQRQAILAGSAGVVLLVGSVVSYILKMHIIAVVGGIVGLACIGFASYNAMKPNTKLEKVEDIDQPNVQSFSNPI